MIVKRIQPRLLFLLLIHLFVDQTLLAGLNDLPIGARSLGMGATYVALANTADAVFLNPGGLDQLQGTEISLFYQKPFGLPDLNYGTVSVSFPIWRQRLGVGFLVLGNRLYKEQIFTLVYSGNFQHKLYYGIGLRYQSLRIEGYGSSGTLGLDFGMVVPLTRQIRLGFLANNLNRPKIGRSSETLPQGFRTGISLEPKPSLILNLEVSKDVRFPLEVRFGSEFKPFENLALRAGTATNPNRFSAGFGVRAHPFTVDYAFFSHNDLGLTHQVSLSVHLGDKPKAKPAEERPVVLEQGPTAKPIGATGAKEAVREKLNINVASLEELLTIPGIGETLARAILAYRDQNGPFERIEDLLSVPGIGPKKLRLLQERVIVDQVANK